MGKSSSKTAKSKHRFATSSSDAAVAAAAAHVQAVRATAEGSYHIESIDQQHNTITTVNIYAY